MQKYGFREGQGLGKHEQGLSTALSVEKTSKRGGKIIVGEVTEKGGSSPGAGGRAVWGRPARPHGTGGSPRTTQPACAVPPGRGRGRGRKAPGTERQGGQPVSERHPGRRLSPAPTGQSRVPSLRSWSRCHSVTATRGLSVTVPAPSPSSEFLLVGDTSSVFCFN